MKLVKCDSFVGYEFGNLSDRVKHSNQEFLLEKIIPQGGDFSFVELHSGEGIYKISDGSVYHGSSFRAFLKGIQKGNRTRLFLHEKKMETRQKLYARMGLYPGVKIGGEWQRSVDSELEHFGDSNTLIFSDPTKMGDHVEVLKNIRDFLSKSDNLFFYIPEGRGVNYSEQSFDFEGRSYGHKEIVELTRSKLSSKAGIDLMCPSEKSGSFYRIDHNIIVCREDIIADLEANHRNNLEGAVEEGKISKERYKKFSDENGISLRI